MSNPQKIRVGTEVITWRIKEQLDVTCCFISLLMCSTCFGLNISIIRSLRLCCRITTSVVLFSVLCVLEIWCGSVWVVSVLQASADVVIRQQSRKLLMMDILMSETCWVHKKWNTIATDIKLVFYSSTITMMHGQINIRSNYIWNVKMRLLTYVWITISNAANTKR